MVPITPQLTNAWSNLACGVQVMGHSSRAVRELQNIVSTRESQTVQARVKPNFVCYSTCI